MNIVVLGNEFQISGEHGSVEVTGSGILPFAADSLAQARWMLAEVVKRAGWVREVKQVKVTKLSKAQQEVLEMVEAGGGEMLLSAMRMASNYSSAISALERKGMLERKSSGLLCITEAGESAIA